MSRPMHNPHCEPQSDNITPHPNQEITLPKLRKWPNVNLWVSDGMSVEVESETEGDDEARDDDVA